MSAACQNRARDAVRIGNSSAPPFTSERFKVPLSLRVWVTSSIWMNSHQSQTTPPLHLLKIWISSQTHTHTHRTVRNNDWAAKLRLLGLWGATLAAPGTMLGYTEQTAVRFVDVRQWRLFLHHLIVRCSSCLVPLPCPHVKGSICDFSHVLVTLYFRWVTRS